MTTRQPIVAAPLGQDLRVWVSPMVVTLAAGAAENAVGNVDDQPPAFS